MGAMPTRKLQDALADLPEMSDAELKELLLQLAEQGDHVKQIDDAIADIRAAGTDDELRERMARWLAQLGSRKGPRSR